MPVLDGIQATRILTAGNPEVAIIILTTYADDTSVLAALRAGARSYLTKDADRADIARALHSAARGLSVMDPAVQATLVAAAATGSTPPAAEIRDLPDGLTRREAEILALIARGMTNPEIAAALVLSNHTVKSHINRIFAKTRYPETGQQPPTTPKPTTFKACQSHPRAILTHRRLRPYGASRTATSLLRRRDRRPTSPARPRPSRTAAASRAASR